MTGARSSGGQTNRGEIVVPSNRLLLRPLRVQMGSRAERKMSAAFLPPSPRMTGLLAFAGIGVLDPSGPGRRVQSLEEDDVCNDDSEVTTFRVRSSVSADCRG